MHIIRRKVFTNDKKRQRYYFLLTGKSSPKIPLNMFYNNRFTLRYVGYGLMFFFFLSPTAAAEYQHWSLTIQTISELLSDIRGKKSHLAVKELTVAELRKAPLVRLEQREHQPDRARVGGSVWTGVVHLHRTWRRLRGRGRLVGGRRHMAAQSGQLNPPRFSHHDRLTQARPVVRCQPAMKASIKWKYLQVCSRCACSGVAPPHGPAANQRRGGCYSLTRWKLTLAKLFKIGFKLWNVSLPTSLPPDNDIKITKRKKCF